MGCVNTGTRRFVSGATLAAHTRVKLSSGVLVAAGATDVALGTTTRPSVAGDGVTVRLRTDVGTVEMIAGAAVALGAEVNAIAAGKVDDNAAASSVKIGTALSAATADGDVIEVLPHTCIDANAA